MPRPQPISGFPEYLPAARMVEMRVLNILSETFELHGFAGIETRAVEPLAQLARKGEITKEVYVVRRLHASADDPDELGLHYDLTVPFARYVLENAGHLVFPFRRYQIQPAWRGERPQEGRYRQFLQADIDVVGQGTLSERHDVEVPLVMLEALERLHTELGLPSVRMHVNNRKLSQGFYEGLGIDDTAEVLQRVDKYDKIGPRGVYELLTGELGLSTEVADKCVALASICTVDRSFAEQVKALGVRNEMMSQGIDELTAVLAEAGKRMPGRMVADLKIARGLDYYTGTVYETFLNGSESLGSVSSGGRYDSLVTEGKYSYPGVGISLGVSRILAPLLGSGVLTASRSVPSCVLVALDSEQARDQALDVAVALRARKIACELAPAAEKYGKQIRYADRRGIPFVWFGGLNGEVKDIRSGEQISAQATSWQPPVADLTPQVVHRVSAQ